MRWSRNALFACLASLLLGAMVPCARAEHRERKRTERVEILELEQRWRQAQLADDTVSMDKLLSDEFLGITASGQVVTKLQQLDRMRTRALDVHKLDLSDTKIKINGPIAVVTSLAQIEGTAEGQPLHGAFRYTRVYQRLPGGGWKITNFEATRVGRPAPVPPPQASAVEPPGAASSSRPASPAGPAFPQSRS